MVSTAEADQQIEILQEEGDAYVLLKYQQFNLLISIISKPTITMI